MFLSGCYMICRILAISGICFQLIKTQSLNGFMYWVGIGFLLIGDGVNYFLRKKDHDKWIGKS